MKTKLTALLIGLLFSIPHLYSQPNLPVQSQPGPIIVCPSGTFQGIHHIHMPKEIRDKMMMKDTGDPCATIEVTYNNFPADAEAAFQEAVDIWSYTLSSDVTIRVEANWTNLGAGVLGSAGAESLFRNFANAPDDSYYPSALADAIAGTDLEPGNPDIEANFNSNFAWYFGTDGNTPFNQFDFVSVVLHELGHGLGFFTSGTYNSGSGGIGYGFNGVPLNYDEFMYLDQNGTDVLSLSQGTPLGDAFTSNNLYCGSPAATAANAGVQPKLYAPATYSSGSSLSHWNESTFPSTNINALMTPQIGPGQSIHNPGPITLGLFEDIGWVLCDDGGGEPVACTDWVNPTPTTGFTAFNTQFGGAPCDDGSGCPFNEIQDFQVHAGDAFEVDNIQAGGTYTFSICNGSGAGSWTPDFTVIAPSSTVDAFGEGDGCSITWTASEYGTYILVVNELDSCGVANDIDNGYAALTCADGTAICDSPICNIEPLSVVGDAAICPGENTTVDVTVAPVIPDGGGVGIHFENVATGSGIYLSNISFPFTFDNDLNGILSANNFDPFEGEYELYAYVYTDANNAFNTICATSGQSVPIDFLSADDPFCVSDPCDNDTEAPIVACQNVTLSLNANGVASLTESQIDNGSTDNCGILSLTLSKSVFSCADLGENTVQLTVTDLSGNSANCNATITVVDNIFPTIIAPEDVSTQSDFLDCTVSNVNLGSPVVNDNCGDLSISNNAPSVFPLGETIVVWTVIDASGNETSDTQLVSITENEGNTVLVTADGNTTFCEGGSVTLTATSGFDSYTWSNGAQTQSIQVSQSGTYSVVAGYGNECSAAVSEDVEVTVLPDTDGDGTCDFEDNCPNDPNKIEPGQCGCGIADTDTDNDGTADCDDNCPNDPDKINPGECGCGVSDIDSDNDATPDCNDLCPQLALPIGAPCDDGNPNTENDIITTDCQCVGSPNIGSIAGTVSWNNACGIRPITVRIYNPQTADLILEVNTELDANGAFTLSDVDSGIYDILVKVDGYLAKAIFNFSVGNSVSLLDIGSIYNGDIIDDNKVDFYDLSVFATAYGSQIGDSNYNLSSDLNCDGFVNIYDLSVFSVAYGISGDQIEP